ncbi:MAG: MBL fold metallo-hydrolase [Actinobacteria bacterium]|nr:MBL fold metallo-hydrolase [Actinomycetota bacterium]
MIEPSRVHKDITALPTFHHLPGIGILTINSFVLHAEQPVIVDTGTSNDRDKMVAAIIAACGDTAPSWLWITHTDADHIGSVAPLLEHFPRLKVVTTYTGLVKMGTHSPVDPRRVRLLNPGETLDLGDRTITAMTPPLFDAPETTGFHDPVSRALFSSDCFGAILPAGTNSINDLGADELLAAQTLWTSIDTPWVVKVDRSLLADELDELRDLAPSMILSAHLPATAAMVDAHLAGIAAAPFAKPFIGHNQATLTQMLQGR